MLAISPASNWKQFTVTTKFQENIVLHVLTAHITKIQMHPADYHLELRELCQTGNLGDE